MPVGQVYKQGWSPDDIAWEKFDASKAEPWMVAIIKYAALIEYNAPDYVAYLKRVFPAENHAEIERWGREESQHGQVLGRWAELADPTFKLEETAARFRAGYRPAHFTSSDATSVRGSRRAELVARCVVESVTSSYYAAIKDITEEPVLKEIAGRIAADEFRHYKLFFENLQKQPEADLPFWRKLLIAVGRFNESDDDEISYAYYCAVVPADKVPTRPYVCSVYSRKLFGLASKLYRRHHIQKLTQMVAKAIGADPQSHLVKMAGAAIWQLLCVRASLARASVGAAA